MKGYGHIRTAKDYLAHVKARGTALAARRQRERAKLAQSIPSGKRRQNTAITTQSIGGLL